jgi:hypothetical protein
MRYTAALPWLSDRPSLDELMARPKWQERAQCRGVGADKFFPVQGGRSLEAITVCAQCPVVDECDQYADRTGSGGVWAGRSRQPRYVPFVQTND